SSIGTGLTNLDPCWTPRGGRSYAWRCRTCPLLLFLPPGSGPAGADRRADGVGQLLDAERLREESYAAGPVGLGQVAGVRPTGEDDAHRRIDLQQSLQRLGTGEARHHHIQDHQVNGAGLAAV